MDLIDLPRLMQAAIKAAIRAGEEILKIYDSSYETTYKEDTSPLTTADLAAHGIISEMLAGTALPVLSEEGKDIPYDERKNWPYFWLVDPLDGTREFIKRNGEFTVNIALIAGNAPEMGVIYQPVTGMLYFGNSINGSFRICYFEDPEIANENDPASILRKAIKLGSGQAAGSVTILASRSHLSAETTEIIASIRSHFPDCRIINAGSSLKFCRLAEGSAQYYPRFGPTMEWDTAAGHAIAKFSGIRVEAWTVSKPLQYNKKHLLNPWFIAWNERFPDFRQ